MATAGNSRILWLIPLLITICLLSLPAYAKYSGGTGEPNGPYQIATAADLIALGETPEDYDKHFILTADIDLDPNLPDRKVFDRAVIAPDTNDVWSGFQGTAFTGVFDGNDHVIRNAYVNMLGNDFVGLFGYLGTDGQIRNLGIENISVFGRDNVGGLVGRNWDGTISNCYSTGSVDGTGRFVGGLVGYNSTGCVIQCYSTGVVRGSRDVGGLVGASSHSVGMGRGPTPQQGYIAESYSTASVSGRDGTGAVAGDDCTTIGVAHKATDSFSAID